MDHRLEAFSSLSPNQQSLLHAMSRHSFSYLIVGGYAVRYYGCLRPTQDVDVFVELTPRDVDILISILSGLGAKDLQKGRDFLLRPEKKIKWCGVEMLTSMPRLEFPDLYVERVLYTYQEVELSIISRHHLVLTKQLALEDANRSSKWKIDEIDLKCLQKGEGAAG